jgi:16S rRNA (guanine527-N7)-methyltransferase
MAPAAGVQGLVEQVLSELMADRCELAPKVASWVEAVAAWNRQMDLTAARDDRELVDLMVADAALLAGAINHSPGADRHRVVDVGAGAGAPGLPLALLRTDLAVTLVEPKQKRAALLRMTLGRLGCQPPRPGGLAPEGSPSVQVLQTRGEAVEERFDIALSRATLSPKAWLALGVRLAPAGEVWVLLAREPAPAQDGWRKVEELRYRWPLTAAERRVACYRPL